MAKTSSGRSSGSRGITKEATTTQQREIAGKGAIREEFLRKKDELLKLKSLDIFLVKDAMGINPKKSDMKLELRDIVKRLKIKNSKTV